MQNTRIMRNTEICNVVFLDGLRLDTYLRVYNLTYTYELADPSSWAFQYQDLEFCKDVCVKRLNNTFEIGTINR